MDEKINILLAEDDPNLGTLLADYLRAKEFDVERCTDGKQGLQAFTKGHFDLLILDVMMPVMDGFTLAKEVRSKNEQVPIIFLTAKSMRQDAITGFQSGGDDYITKPFSMEELLLRVSAVLKRARGITNKPEEIPIYSLGTSTFDPKKQTLLVNNKERKLTTKENELLRLLCEHMDNTLHRSEALRRIWGDDSYFNGRSMDVYIAKLRKYLRADEQLEIINVHGKGFKLVSRTMNS